MSVSKFIPVAILASLLLSGPSSGSGGDQLVWGENVGLVAARVDKIDDEKGLTVHASPSAESPVLIHLPLGTKIQGANEFKDGWVKLKGPAVPAWVNLKFLKPIPFEGTVTTVDQNDLCLGIRAGPSTSREKVGCAQIGEVLKFTGIMTADNWLQLTDRQGWVDASSVQLPPEAPQTFEANKRTPSVSSVKPVESSSPEKRVATTPQLGPTIEKKSGYEEAPAGSPTTPGPSGQIAAPAPRAAQGKEELPPVVCTGGWCVNYSKSQVTHNGKAVSVIECLKNEICASIVGKHHVVEATRNGSMTFGNFKLLANGVILDSESGKVVVNCNNKGGVDHKCVANFLRKTFVGISGKNTTGSVSGKGAASKESIKKKAENSSESKQPRSTAGAPERLQSFDRNACYSKCPCGMGVGQACADCRQKCDDQYWKAFDEKSK